jgi:hypothetical protein
MNKLASFIRRRKNLLAYLLLAGFIAYALYQVQIQGQQAAQNLARQTAERRAAQIEAGTITTRLNCERDRVTILRLRGIIKNGRVSTEQFYKDGTINVVQRNRSLKNIDDALKRLRVPDCDQFVKDYVRRASAPRPKG